MYGWLKLVAGVVIAALLGVAVWGCFGIAHHLIVAVDRFGDAGAGLAETTAKLNGRHGTIAMADEDVGAVKSLIVHADLAARHEQQQMTTWDTRGAILFANLNGGVSDLRGTVRKSTDAVSEVQETARAATGLLNTANTALDQLNDDKDGLSPVMRTYLNTGNDLDALLKRKAVSDILDHAAGITLSADGILADGKRVADKASADYLTPKPWYIKARNYAGDTYDLAALFARHTP